MGEGRCVRSEVDRLTQVRPSDRPPIFCCFFQVPTPCNPNFTLHRPASVRLRPVSVRLCSFARPASASIPPLSQHMATVTLPNDVASPLEPSNFLDSYRFGPTRSPKKAKIHLVKKVSCGHGRAEIMSPRVEEGGQRDIPPFRPHRTPPLTASHGASSSAFPA